tara:strand:+ start:1927 stop:2688 length:762 start_codon:yes stop_codon:yes gene_type:complete
MSHNIKVRALQVVNHLLFAVGIAYVVMTGEYSYALVGLLSYWGLGVLGINIGYHRLLAHRSFSTYPIVEKVLSVIGVITSVGSPLAWVTLHRMHHKTTETAADPHSPYLLGNFRAWFGFWNITHLDLSLSKDIRKDKFQKRLHKYYFEIILVYCVALAMIDPMLIIFAYCIPACLCLHSSSAIIVIAHRQGYKTHDLGIDEARNSWVASLITLGEGWHNNHHHNPRAWSNQEKWWELDPNAWLIKLIKRNTKK